MRGMIQENTFRQKYIFSVLSAVRGLYGIATPLLALVEVAHHQPSQQ